ncbi:MAG: S41 family peptidase [Anaerolineales bacterium]|nr:S41 family peptidase [Anaerolineales bacterium]
MFVVRLALPVMRNTAVVAFALLSTLLTACVDDRSAAQLPTPYPKTDLTERQLRSYDAFWEGLQAGYIFGAVTSFDWTLLPPQARRKVAAGMSDADFEALLRSLVADFPENTVRYRTRAERIENDLNNTRSYEGIGAYVSVANDPSPHVILLAVIPGSPAEKAGLRTHDSIYAVDGQAVTAEEGLDVVERVRGPAGSVVTLDVRAPDGNQRIVKVTRMRLQAADRLRWEFKDLAQAGLIRLPIGAGAELIGMMQRALEGLAKHEPNNLIIDMRVAHSADGWPLKEMLGLFTEGEMGSQYSHSARQTLKVKGRDVAGSQSLPLILLIGPDTRGASEIFAAALQATDRATLIGRPTLGHVLGFDHFMLPDGGEVYFSSSSYISPSGADIGMRGIQPDVTMETSWDQVTDDDDAVIRRALIALTQ